MRAENKFFPAKHQANFERLTAFTSQLKAGQPIRFEATNPYNEITSLEATIRQVKIHFGRDPYFTSLLTDLDSLLFQRSKTHVLVTMKDTGTPTESADANFSPETFSLEDIGLG